MRFRKIAAVVGAVAVMGVSVAGASASAGSVKPTVVLVHGAFADGSSWNGVIERLQRDGYDVVAPAVPLRELASDSAYVADVVRSVGGPVVLVGHSYGGAVISQVAAQVPGVKALVYAAAFIPVAGESLGQLNAQFPGSLLGPDTTRTVGGDLYVKKESFRAVFAGDRSVRDAAVMAAAQRPVVGAVLGEAAAATAPASVPDYAIVATEDRAIPADAERFMAKRAGAWTVEVRSAHDLPVSHPEVVASVIEKAARGR